MPILPHERDVPPHLRHGHEPTHSDLMEKLEAIEEMLRSIEERK